MLRIHKLSIFPLSIFALGALVVGCDRMITPPAEQTLKDAEAKAAQGDYGRAINLYEAALDDSPRSAKIHYQLALLYDDKLHEPLNALHHFKRCLALDPNGPRATEVKELMKRDEIALATTLSGDAVVTRAEAARLRNENLNLRKQIDERGAKTKAPNVAGDRLAAASSQTEGPHSYVVQTGDTLFSIARKFYKSPARWKEIRDANQDKIDNGSKLKPGTRLTIP